MLFNRSDNVRSGFVLNSSCPAVNLFWYKNLISHSGLTANKEEIFSVFNSFMLLFCLVCKG